MKKTVKKAANTTAKLNAKAKDTLPAKRKVFSVFSDPVPQEAEVKDTSSTKRKAKAAPPQGLKKQYVKSNLSCKVTFRLPKEAVRSAKAVTLVGDFNNWDLTETKMQRLPNGDFKATLELSRDREYKFKYLIDYSRWENDWSADKYIPNEYGSDDSVVIV